MTELFISAAGDYCERCDGGDIDFKPLVADAVGQPVRRVGRFIQLALIGAGRCAKAARLSQDAAVYLGSGRGDLEITIEVMQALLRDGHAPKPLSFINTVSNAACYYVAQNLKLASRSSFVCNRYFAFETMLQLAAMDLRAGSISSALVGTVDVVVPPLQDHRKRLGLVPDAPVADASHWLCLSTKAASNALGKILAVENFPDVDAMQAWLEQNDFGKECAVSGGQFLGDDEFDELSRKNSFARVFSYRDDRAYYDSQSGAVIGEFLRANSSEAQLIHINRDPSGRYCVMQIQK